VGAQTIVAFGDLLRRQRLAAGLTQEDLAERAGLSRRGISDLERGVNQKPRKDTIALLAQALALSPSQLATFVASARRGSPLAATGLDQAAGGESAAPPLIGRSRELERLERHLSGAGPPVLLLAGEPGIGKTRLLQEAAVLAQGAGFRVLAGGCSRRGGQEPYAPLVQALAGPLAGLPRAATRAALHGCTWMVRLLPEIAELLPQPVPAWQLAPEQERRLIFAAAARFLTNLAGPRGTFLVLDDLQWAGPDALDLLASLLRGAQGAPLRVVGAYRDTELSPERPLASALSDLAQAGVAQQMTVGPLASVEARALLDVLLTDQDAGAHGLADEALQRMEGVPFFAVSWARSLHDSGATGTTGAVPWSVSQSIRQRVAALPAGARELLSAAAVLGRVVSRPLLVRVCGLERAAVVADIEAACRARLLEEEGTAAYRFVHDIIREVIESDLGSARRAALHIRAGEALEDSSGGGAVETLAYHFERGEAPERAVVYLELAGDKARAQRAHEAAADYYRRLMARLDTMERASARAAACEKLGGVLVALARYEEALAVLERAAAHHAAESDLDDLARVTAQIGWVHAQKWTPEEGLARIQPLLAPLEAHGPSPGLAALYMTLAWLTYILNRYQEFVAAAARAVELAQAVRETGLLARALCRQGLALIQVGRFEACLRVVAEARGLAESVGDLSSLREALALTVLGHYALGELAASGRYAEQEIDVATRLGDPAEIVQALSDRGRNAYLMGDWSRARVDLEQAVRVSNRIGVSMAVTTAVVFLAELYLSAGEWDEATRCLGEALAAAGRNGAYGGRIRHAQILRAEYDLLTGHPEAARDRLLPLQDAEDTWNKWLQTHLAWAYLELGDARRAADTMATIVRQARSEKHRIRLVDALHVQARALAALGHDDGAAAALDEGLTLALALPYPYGEARLLHVYGLLHRQRGETERARQRLAAARATFGRLGARKDVERVAQDIAAGG
jgi:transcriptional regulator with XRE-family HTH domain/tetratricopeptide (TPR) repeat protein